ncbi:hypothetical protein DN069_38360 [Streptacidiphilus pinicola]|uniref:Uncharacterized protein n=1 Tax=Streptacidiphilus pinicola TaxID=2219663 RepID=A0A2X0I9R8_9ACTN|nr:hypothetical protein [Streptacidiphilus pinicola]RAG80393.1 hypothetical protein DN069_38360 [Streptacidiphilus pinicola]
MSATQTKRSRWKLVTGAGVAVAAATGVALSGVASASATAGSASPAVQAAKARTAARTTAATSALPGVTSVLVGQGRMGHVSWKVVLEYYRHLPRGYHVPSMPPGIPTPKYTGLLCERMYLDGVRIDHQGGPWSDCNGVTGATRPIGTEEGLYGLTAKGTSGYRLFVGETSAPVGYAVLTYTDGHSYRANSAHLRGTGFNSYAIPISKGRYIRSVDTYTADGHRLSHETDWH